MESKFYKSNESPGKFELNHKQYTNENGIDDIDMGAYGGGIGDETEDNLEDDKLLQSLEKRLRNLDEKKEHQNESMNNEDFGGFSKQ